MNEGLAGLRESDELGIGLPTDISDDVCEVVKRTLLKGLLRPTFSSNNEASKVLQMSRVRLTDKRCVENFRLYVPQCSKDVRPSHIHR